MRVGFAGLGRMGAHMARHLSRAGHDLKLWNRSADKSEALTELMRVYRSVSGSIGGYARGPQRAVHDWLLAHGSQLCKARFLRIADIHCLGLDQGE